MDKEANRKYRIECPHRRTGYFFTQFLTGHGSFGTYTKRIKKTRDDLCYKCGVKDSPEHVLYYCKRWERERRELKEELGDIPKVDEVMKKMTQNRDCLEMLYKYITEIMRRKEKEDRDREERRQ